MKNKSAKKVNKNPLKRSKLGIIFASLLTAGTLASTAVCLWQVNSSKTSSSDFANSINARIEVDATAFEPEGSKTYENAQKNVKQAAETLSGWLKTSGQENYDVAYESYEDKDKGTFTTYLNARFTIDKIKNKKPKSKEEEEEKIDNDPYLSIFSSKGFNTNNRSLVYRWYIEQDQPDQTTPQFSVVNLSDVVSIPKDLSKKDNPTKIIADKDGKYGVMYSILDPDQNALLNAIYKDMAKAYNYTQQEDPKPSGNAKTLDTWRQPRLYVVNNLEGMVNEANYHLMNYRAGQKGLNDEYNQIYSGTEYESFAKSYIEKDDKGKPDSSHTNAYSLLEGKISTSLKVESDGKPSSDTFVTTPNHDILRYIDSTTAGTIANSFMSKYVEKVYTITSKNFQKAFPAKITDSYTNDVDETLKDLEKTKLNYFWFESSGKDDATEYLNKLIKYHLPVKIVNVTVGSQSTILEDKLNLFKASYLTVKVHPKFIDTIFGGNRVQFWLSVGLLVFLIALLVILACLYRTTGVFSWICMMFMLSLTQLIATFSVSVISMSTLIGLFAVALVGFATCLAICGRIKRRLNSNEDTQVMIVKAFKKSLFPTLDFSIIALIFGICITYIAPISLNVFGLLLIVGAFANFGITYLLNGGIQLLMFKNHLTLNKFKLFGKPSNKANEELRQGNMQVPSSLDTSKLNFDYYSSMGKKKYSLFTKKTWIALIVLAVVFIVGFVLLGINGFVTNSMFHSSMCIAIYHEGGDLLKQDWFINAGLKYSYYRMYDNWWYFYTSDNVSASIQALIESGKVTAGQTICVQSIVGSTNIDILKQALFAIIISAIIITLYSIPRFNVASAVPTLCGTFVIPLLMLAVSAICQIKFDDTVVLGMVLVTIVNALMIMNTLATIQDSWSRKDAFVRVEFRYIIDTVLKSNWTFIWVMGLALAILVICFGITSPIVPTNITIISLIGLMIIGSAIALFVTPWAISYVEYFFLGFRNNILAKRAARLSNKVSVNYDEIDEQTIEGVNKFTKVKQVPKYEPWKKAKNEQDSTKNI